MTTVAIDVMPPERRGSGIAYYGVANNLSMCIGPMTAMFMYQGGMSYEWIFSLALFAAGIGFAVMGGVNVPEKEIMRNKESLSLDRFWLANAWRESVNLIFISFSYGLLTTFLAIYGKEELGIEGGSGTFFLLFAIGIIASRLFASHWINKGFITINITVGTIILVVGYLMFALWIDSVGYFMSAVIIGLGQGMFLPACQTIFINLAPNSKRGTANSTYLTSWDVGAGIGIVAGGIIVDHFGYSAAFLSAAISVSIGLLLFQLFTAPHFIRNRLR